MALIFFNIVKSCSFILLPLLSLEFNLTYRGDFKLFQKYKGVLQCIVAVVNAYTDLDNEHRDEVLSAEKVIANHFEISAITFTSLT